MTARRGEVARTVAAGGDARRAQLRRRLRAGGGARPLWRWSEATGRRDGGGPRARRLPLGPFPGVAGHHGVRTRRVGGARGGDPARAREAVARLETIRVALTDRKDEYWAEQVEIQRLAGAGWLAQAEGKAEEARTLLRAAADREDRSEKHPVTPGAVLPAREMLGDLLLEQGRAEEALAAYETSLQSAPGRFRSVAGAARAAGRAGSPAKARDYYAKLLALSEKSDGSRPETAEARAFLAKAD